MAVLCTIPNDVHVLFTVVFVKVSSEGQKKIAHFSVVYSFFCNLDFLLRLVPLYTITIWVLPLVTVIGCCQNNSGSLPDALERGGAGGKHKEHPGVGG